MADLKAGTTVGGSVVWHQGNFPLSALTPASNDVYYKTYKIYSEWSKPQAVDNDFVSKASGGTFASAVAFTQGITFPDSAGYQIKLKKNDTVATQDTFTAGVQVKAPFAIMNDTGQPFIIFNPALPGPAGSYRLTVMGDILGRKIYDEAGQVFGINNPPTKAQVGLDLVDNAKQVQLELINTQTMAGELRAPSFSITTKATRADQVPRFDQIVPRDSIQDFGTY